MPQRSPTAEEQNESATAGRVIRLARELAATTRTCSGTGADSPACAAALSRRARIWPETVIVDPRAQADTVLEIDFLRVDIVMLQQLHAAVVIDSDSRQARLLGVTGHPTGLWATQMA